MYVSDVLLEVVELGADQRNAAGAERRAALGGIRNAQRAAAFDPVIVALALDLEVAGGELQPLVVVGAEVPADLQEQVLGLRVRRPSCWRSGRCDDRSRRR